MVECDRSPGAGPAAYRVGFLLIENYTLMALASAIEPLRMANQLTGSELYTWQLVSVDGQPVRASDGMVVMPDAAMADGRRFDLVIVVAGINVTRSFNGREQAWLRDLARRGMPLGALCTGAYVLASAGLLDGYHCSAHWECLAALQEGFPRVRCNNRLFSLDRDRMTCTGGEVPLHMMLGMLARRHGQPLADAISDMFVCDRVREDCEQQPLPLRHQLAVAQPKLAEVAQLMEANIEEPLELQELAMLAAVSRRQLERLFLKHLGCTPSRYYLKLRLDRARRLLKQTSCSVVEIAAMCGFVSATHFSRCYRKYMGAAPKADRQPRTASLVAAGAEAAPFGEWRSPATDALSRAQAEPTFGVFRYHPLSPD
ncbi:choline metabolism transcriptional regulator GbdR [Marinobacter xestospongiae]|uniref:GlxA family transcriptional regulator n=1 Tax=Marinobacter xestospongiae TaxID=994319 RepID=A0ABU3VT49_9GAMM|nr:GlxA family transcriptional regulator [Marinobacter xestospongiae]MDV2077433.1 GlxA family transcriptional regulator [Marinobacter xestospongiae]